MAQKVLTEIEECLEQGQRLLKEGLDNHIEIDSPEHDWLKQTTRLLGKLSLIREQYETEIDVLTRQRDRYKGRALRAEGQRDEMLEAVEHLAVIIAEGKAQKAVDESLGEDEGQHGS